MLDRRIPKDKRGLSPIGYRGSGKEQKTHYYSDMHPNYWNFLGQAWQAEASRALEGASPDNENELSPRRE
ncbi:hypothetical protein KJ628_00440 [Patescibacteria group bacterium]|nr:hypothetical protein [Patescibacteria group bacterium]